MTQGRGISNELHLYVLLPFAIVLSCRCDDLNEEVHKHEPYYSVPDQCKREVPLLILYTSYSYRKLMNKYEKRKKV